MRANGELRMLLWGVDTAAGTIEHLNPIQVAPWALPGIVAPPRGGDRPPFGLSHLQPTVPPFVGPRLTTRGSTRPTGRFVSLFTALRTTPLVPLPPSGPIGPVGPTRPAPRPPALAFQPEDDDPPGRTPGADAAIDIAFGGDAPFVYEARVAYADDGNLAVVTSTDQGVYLHSFGITASQTIVLRDTAFVGGGDAGRVAVAGNDQILVAYRNGDARLALASFELDGETGLIGNALDEIETADEIDDDLDLALGRKRQLFLRSFITTARTDAGDRRLHSWRIHRVTGALSLQDATTAAAAGSSLQIERVTGFGSREIYATAFRTPGSRMSVQTIELDPSGAISSPGFTATTDVFLGLGSRVVTAPYAEGGLMIAVQPTITPASHRLEAWSIDPRSWSQTSTVNLTTLTPNRIARETVDGDGMHAICRLPGEAAEGDFVVARGKPGENGIELDLWRSAPR